MKFRQIWNGRLLGIIPAFVTSINIAYGKILDIISNFLVKLSLHRVGDNTRFQSGFIFRFPGSISFGVNCRVGRKVEFSTEIPGSTIRVGHNVQINRGCFLDFSGNIIINDNVLISECARVYSHSHALDPRSKPKGIPLEVSENVWIGSGASIMHNVTYVGQNSVIAAHSVVTANVPDNVIVAGVPAKVIRHL